MEKVVLLNALVPPPGAGIIEISEPLSLEKILPIVINTQKLESYIGHEATAKLLTKLFGKEVQMNRSMYIPKHGDIAIIVRLKKRLEKPEDIENIKQEDLEFRTIKYSMK